MELNIYLSVLWRRKLVIVLTATVTILVTILGTYMLTPEYEASATLWVPTSEGSGTRTGDIMLADRLMNTYAALATSSPILAKVQQQLGLDEIPQVTVEFITESELMQIKVEDANPTRATDVANQLAEALISESRKTRAGRDQKAFFFARAVTPTIPVKPWWALNIILGSIVGLAAGVGLAFLFENLDTTLYTPKQIKTVTELTILAEIPTAKGRKPITFLNGNSPQGEAFRYLRTSIFFDQNTLPKTLLITSAIPGEGKSTIVSNLALAVAQSKRQVIVVDGDLRLPTLHKIFNLPNEIGLSNILQQNASLAEAVQNSHLPGIQVLPSGPTPPHPAKLLDSPQVATLIEQLKQQFDLVIIDTPSLLAVKDAAVLAPLVDGIALVVGQAQVQQEVVQVACQQLTAVKARLIGIIVNRTNQNGSYHTYYPQKIASHNK